MRRSDDTIVWFLGEAQPAVKVLCPCPLETHHLEVLLVDYLGAVSWHVRKTTKDANRAAVELIIFCSCKCYLNMVFIKNKICREEFIEAIISTQGFIHCINPHNGPPLGEAEGGVDVARTVSPEFV